METKTVKNVSREKGGKNPFGKVTISAASIIVGAGLAQAVDRWRMEHPADEPKPADKPNEHSAVEEEMITENHQEQPADEIDNVSTNPQSSDEPTPIDPEEQVLSEETEHPEPVNGNEDTEVNDIAEKIANSEEIDPVDAGTVAFMNVGEHRTFYSETGEIDVFEIEINDPNLAGYPFMIADTDGDGYYDSILMVDGTPADIRLEVEPGNPDQLDYYIAEARISKSDLEEMHETDGGEMVPDDSEDLAQYNPGEDVINENGETVQTGGIAQTENDETVDDVDEAAYMLLLAQLLEEDEEEGEVIDGEDDEEEVDLLAEIEDDETEDENEYEG